VPAPDKAPSVITRFFAAVRGLVTIRTPHRGSDRVGSRLRVSVIFQKKISLGCLLIRHQKEGYDLGGGLFGGGEGVDVLLLRSASYEEIVQCQDSIRGSRRGDQHIVYCQIEYS